MKKRIFNKKTESIMSAKNFGLGLVLGAAVGAIVVYFSNAKCRDSFCEDVSDLSERAQDGLMDTYKKAKDKYNSYRRKVKGTTEELLNEAAQELEELAD